jgi:hypothetical protein
MGMGGLAVAWDIPIGTKEIVTDKGRFFAPLGNFDVMAGYVMKLLGEHASRYEASARRIREEFSEEAMWRRYESALGGIAATPRVSRPLAGKEPPPYHPPRRILQLLPPWIRNAVRWLVGRWPRVGFALRNFRGR